MEISNVTEFKDEAYKLAEINYMISLTQNYISVLLSEQVGNENDSLKIALFHHSLVKEQGLSNISETLSIVKEKIEASANYFLDEVE